MEPEVEIFTDGACSGNPGPGGWAALLRAGEREREIAGGERLTTNQRMELRAAVEGLKALKRPSRVALYSDSAYLVNCFRDGWWKKWEANGWKNAGKKPVANDDLWKELVRLNREHDVDWRKVKGHSGHVENERVDQIARRECERISRAS